MLDGPILDKIKVNLKNEVDKTEYPFSIPLIQNLKEIVFPTQVTFFIGENGTGKSTILESIAEKAGFGREGGSKNINFITSDEKFSDQTKKLADTFLLSWRKKVKDGYFFRAESFFTLANQIDVLAKEDPNGPYQMWKPYGGKSLHQQSHGESFLSFFDNRLGGGGFYIFDEPEAALSPQRQLGLLRIIHELSKNPETQFVIATHSPILLAYPDATIYSCDGDSLEKVKYEDTKHYQITRDFLNSPNSYLKKLFN